MQGDGRMIKYIQRRQGRTIETVDRVDSKDYPTRSAFRVAVVDLLANYRMADSSAFYYVSSKRCR